MSILVLALSSENENILLSVIGVGDNFPGIKILPFVGSLNYAAP